MRKGSCRPRCNFKPFGNKGKERCQECEDIFPCNITDGECGHLDCEEVRGLPRCNICHELIEPADRFCLSGPKNWIPVHRKCVDLDSMPEVKVDLPWNGQVGTGVKLDEKVEAGYRGVFGDLVDDLVVETVVDDGKRVIVKWIGMVPITHLRMK